MTDIQPTAKKKKIKPPRTFAQDQERVSKSRAEALTAAVMFFSFGKCDDQAARKTQGKFGSYHSQRIQLDKDWDAAGNKLDYVKTFRPLWWAKATEQNDGTWTGELYERKERGKIVHETIPGCESKEDALKSCVARGRELGINVARRYHKYVEGELIFETEMGKLAEFRNAFMTNLTTLVLTGGKKSSADQVELMIENTHRALGQYLSRLKLCNEQWSKEGAWLGPKKPEPKQEGETQ